MLKSWSKRFYSKEFILILLNSILFGIWAIKDVIALRHMLLVSIFLLGTWIFVVYFKKKAIRFEEDFYLLATCCLFALMCFWMLMQYCFLSQYPELLKYELLSTWLRVFLAVWCGFYCGIIIQQRHQYLNCLYLGVLISFLILFIQYLDKADFSSSLFAFDWWGHYIFLGKINAVLIGTIAIAGMGGSLLDVAKASGFKFTVARIALSIFLTFLILYSYVFIFDSRMGLVLAALLGVIWICIGTYFSFGKPGVMGRLKFISCLSILIIGVGLFAAINAEKNVGWKNLVSDAKIAVQINKYQNWKNPVLNGWPNKENGEKVVVSNYERIAWFVAGAREVPRHFLGLGTLNKPFTRIVDPKLTFGTPVSTHSGWIDMALGYGIPFVVLIFLQLGLIGWKAFTSSGENKYFILSLLSIIVILYTVGELSTQHSIEILFYLLSFLWALQVSFQAVVLPSYQMNGEISPSREGSHGS